MAMSREKRKKSSGQKRLFIFTLFIVHCSLFIFSSCQNPFASQKPVNIPEGKGALSLSVTVVDMNRTILPNTPNESSFVLYTLDFSPTSGGDAHDEDRADLSEPVYLVPGTYTLEVTAYYDAGKTKVAARGSKDGLVISEGNNTGATVELEAMIGEGTGSFSYTVNYPSGLKTASMKITPLGTGSPAQDVNLLSGAAGTLSLISGYYNVVFTLEKNNDQTLVWREWLHVYASLESKLETSFTDDDFHKTIYTVTFEFNDGVTSRAPQSVTHGDTVGSFPNPTRYGYSFGGWFSDLDPATVYVFSTPVVSNITLYAKWTANTAVINITVEDIEDIAFDNITSRTLSRSGTNNTVTFNLISPGLYESYQWTIEGINANAENYPITSTDSWFTVDADDPRYNSSGKHAVYLEVRLKAEGVPEGVPYSKTIWVMIAGNDDEEDFGLGAAIDNTFNITGADDWNNAKTVISGGGPNKNYIINVTDDFTVAGSTANTFGDAANIKVSLRGAGRTLTLVSPNGNLLRTGANQTVILRDITLQGRTGNNNSVVYVTGTNSAFTMQSGEIFDNSSSNSGGGVYVDSGTFTMYGGEISGNTTDGATATTGGGGVYVSSNGTFTMYGGEISGNTGGGDYNNNGGGVYSNGTFTMYGGTISGNTASSGGGGVHIFSGNSFTMYGGTISGNSGPNGGGVNTSGTFTMHGGTVSGNSGTNGGGVYMTGANAIFRIVTGTIYGSGEGTNSNTANSGAALHQVSGTAQCGTLNGTAWTQIGENLLTTNDTIRVVNGELIQ
jgi:uncharacterized repeat protein (TIGR02543 family)